MFCYDIIQKYYNSLNFNLLKYYKQNLKRKR